jgi:hypothetical protein
MNLREVLLLVAGFQTAWRALVAAFPPMSPEAQEWFLRLLLVLRLPPGATSPVANIQDLLPLVAAFRAARRALIAALPPLSAEAQEWALYLILALQVPGAVGTRQPRGKSVNNVPILLEVKKYLLIPCRGCRWTAHPSPT